MISDLIQFTGDELGDVQLRRTILADAMTNQLNKNASDAYVLGAACHSCDSVRDVEDVSSSIGYVLVLVVRWGSPACLIVSELHFIRVT